MLIKFLGFQNGEYAFRVGGILYRITHATLVALSDAMEKEETRIYKEQVNG